MQTTQWGVQCPKCEKVLIDPPVDLSLVEFVRVNRRMTIDVGPALRRQSEQIEWNLRKHFLVFHPGAWERLTEDMSSDLPPGAE